MNSRVFLASLFLFPATFFCMEENKSDLTLADFKPLIERDEIQRQIFQVSKRLFADYGPNKSIMMIMIMKGAIHLASDLSRTLGRIPGYCGAGTPSTLDFIQASSYGQNGTESGQLTLSGIERLNLAGKDVLLIDDIFDTGKTLTAVKKELLKLNPASLKTLVLLLKDKKRETTELPDYHLFKIENQFVIGYGLDYKEKFRELTDIWVKK